MILCLSDEKQPTASKELNKVTKSLRLQISYANEKLSTILSQANASQISRQTIGNNHCYFKPLAWIITERLGIIQIEESSNFIREETKEECQDETTKYKADKSLTCL